MKTRTKKLTIILVLSVAAAMTVARRDGTNPTSLIRLTPQEIASLPSIGAGAGTSGVAGIATRVLKGDPTKSGLYTIELRVPPHTQIAAHTHPDDRVATVVSGIWFFGYGTQFEATKLKALPPGSFYTEPSDEPHFARTGNTAVVVDITGYGPTGTHYVSEPEARSREEGRVQHGVVSVPSVVSSALKLHGVSAPKGRPSRAKGEALVTGVPPLKALYGRHSPALGEGRSPLSGLWRRGRTCTRAIALRFRRTPTSGLSSLG